MFRTAGHKTWLCAVVTSLAASQFGWAAAPTAAPLPAPEAVTVAHFPSAREALEAVLAIPARIVAFGELHQTVKTAKIRSSLARFADELLPLVAEKATDVVVETWIADGRCGKPESHVVSEVETSTERPPETENEIVTLLRRAKAAGLLPHILRLSCQDYRKVTSKNGVLDFAKMLRLTRRRLAEEASRALDAGASADKKPVVVVYGGALHNDLHPKPADKSYAFGPALFAKSNGQYLEVDLFVPEYIDGEPLVTSEPWYRLFVEHSLTEDALLIRLSERSFIIVFPRSRERK
jgi:hypothetical protein